MKGLLDCVARMLAREGEGQREAASLAVECGGCGAFTINAVRGTVRARAEGGPMKRREFIAGLGGAAATASVGWPRAARAEQRAMPVVGVLNGSAADASAGFVAAFRKGLSETGFVEGRNVTVEYHWLEGQYDRLLPALGRERVQPRVARVSR